MSRRFPASRREEKFSGGYVVRDANGFAVAYACGRFFSRHYARGRRAREQNGPWPKQVTPNIPNSTAVPSDCRSSAPCVYRKSDSAILVMKATKDRL
jgi:hypothetical protein